MEIFFALLAICEETSTGHWWTPLTKASNTKLSYFHRSLLFYKPVYTWDWGQIRVSTRISKVFDEIPYRFPNFNLYTVEVWECISNSPHTAITYPY